MEEKLGSEEQETDDFNSETKQTYSALFHCWSQESDNEQLEETNEENELRSRSTIRRNQERYEKKTKRKTKQVSENNQEKHKSNKKPKTTQV